MATHKYTHICIYDWPLPHRSQTHGLLRDAVLMSFRCCRLVFVDFSRQNFMYFRFGLPQTSEFAHGGTKGAFRNEDFVWKLSSGIAESAQTKSSLSWSNAISQCVVASGHDVGQRSGILILPSCYVCQWLYNMRSICLGASVFLHSHDMVWSSSSSNGGDVPDSTTEVAG